MKNVKTCLPTGKMLKLVRPLARLKMWCVVDG